MAYRIVFTPEARDQLLSIHRYIAAEASADRASAFVTAIVDYCESLRTFPKRGTRRDDLRPGLRTVGFRRRVTIAFAVEEQIVAIIGVFYGGQEISAEHWRGVLPRP